MSEKKSKGIRCSNAFVEIYPDDPNYGEYKRRIEENYDFVYILHNLDVKEDTGELKKPHYHYLLKFNGQVSISTISYVTGVPDNYIKARSDYRSAFRYLMHIDHPEKHQYDAGQIQGVDVKARVAKYCSISENDTYGRVVDVIIRVCQGNPTASLSSVVAVLIQEGLFGYYRQAQYTFMEILKEMRSYTASAPKQMKGEELNDF